MQRWRRSEIKRSKGNERRWASLVLCLVYNACCDQSPGNIQPYNSGSLPSTNSNLCLGRAWRLKLNERARNRRTSRSLSNRRLYSYQFILPSNLLKSCKSPGILPPIQQKSYKKLRKCARQNLYWLGLLVIQFSTLRVKALLAIS